MSHERGIPPESGHQNIFFRTFYRSGAPAEKMLAGLRAQPRNDNAYCNYLTAARMLDEAREIRALAKKNGDPAPGGAIQKTGEAVILLLDAGGKKQFDPGYAAEAETHGCAADDLIAALDRNALYAANDAMNDSLPAAFELTQYLERSVRNRPDAETRAFLDHENGRWIRFVELVLNAPEQTLAVWRTAESALRTGARVFPDRYRTANAPDRAAEIENWYANALAAFSGSHCAASPEPSANRLNADSLRTRQARSARMIESVWKLENIRRIIAWILLPALAIWLIFAFCAGRCFKTAATCCFAVSLVFPLLYMHQTRQARERGFYFLPPPSAELASEAGRIQDALSRTRAFLRGEIRPAGIEPKCRALFFNGFGFRFDVGADGAIGDRPFRFIFAETLPEEFRRSEYLAYPLAALAFEKSKFESGDPAGVRYFPDDAEFTVSPGPAGAQVQIRIRDRADSSALPLTVYWHEPGGRILLNPPSALENNPFIREVPETFMPQL